MILEGLAGISFMGLNILATTLVVASLCSLITPLIDIISKKGDN